MPCILPYPSPEWVQAKYTIIHFVLCEMCFVYFIQGYKKELKSRGSIIASMILCCFRNQSRPSVMQSRTFSKQCCHLLNILRRDPIALISQCPRANKQKAVTATIKHDAANHGVYACAHGDCIDNEMDTMYAVISLCTYKNIVPKIAASSRKCAHARFDIT